jgi:hypothetical protein
MNLPKAYLTILLVIAPPTADARWPALEFAHVVAFCYDFSQDARGTSIVFPDKSLHRGIIRSTTSRLIPKQITELRKILSTEWEGESGESDCYDPHHAFVFYDAEWKPVAWIDICFLCEGFTSHPAGVREKIDLDSLHKLLEEIGLPIHENSQDYTKLYRQEQPSGKTPEPVENADRDPFANP